MARPVPSLGAMWASASLDWRLAAVLKAAALAYCIAAPYVWGPVDGDLKPALLAACALGALAFALDPFLGLLVLSGVAGTAMTISQRNAEKKLAARPAPEEFVAGGALTAAATGLGLSVFAPRRPRGEVAPPPVRAVPPAPEQVHAAPPSPVHPVPAAPERKTTARTAPSLLEPDGSFVTAASLEAVQSNVVGPDDSYSPLGSDSYGAQGRAVGVPVVPMPW